jgi:hypothetical protein
MVVGVALLLPQTRAVAGAGAATLLAAYAGAVLINLLRGRADIDCGCGGTAQPLSYWLVLRNVLLGGAALLLLATPAARGLGLGDALALLPLTLLLVLAYLTAGEVIKNHSSLRSWSR